MEIKKSFLIIIIYNFFPLMLTSMTHIYYFFTITISEKNTQFHYAIITPLKISSNTIK